MINQISVVIITRNAAATLAATLDSTRAFANVVVWDNGSTDDTRAIAARYPNAAWHEGTFVGFGPSKNAAVACASNDWVLSLDADERLSEPLLDALRAWPTGDPLLVGEVLRENWFMGQPVRRGGWGNDYLIRLFNRASHQFDDAIVHEKVLLSSASQVQRLPAYIQHEAVTNIGQFLQKIDRYSELRRATGGKTYSMPVIVIKSAFAFFRSYVLQLGVLAGWRGVVIAWSNANGVFYKYTKILADRR